MIFRARKDLLELDNIELSVYLSIQSLAEETKTNELYLSNNNLIYFMRGNNKQNKATRKYIIDGLNNLFEKKIIEYHTTIMGDYIINKNSFCVKDIFTYLRSEDIRTIMMTQNKDRYSLLKFMYVLMGSVQNKNKIGNMSHLWLAEQCGISHSSSIKYMKELEKLKIIYVRRSTKISNEELHRQRNVYGHISNKELVNIFADNYFADINDNSKNDRYKKSMAAKYNQVVAGKVYAADEMREIFSYIKAQNEYEKKCASENAQYIPKIRDLSVFNLTKLSS